MKKKIFSFFMLLSLFSMVVGCQSNNKNSIVGKWAQNKFVYTFKKDKKCSYSAYGTLMKCTYKIDGDTLSILYDGNTVPFNTKFKISGNKLTIKDSLNRDVVYERQ